ncbi:winged helix-turn-helix domain-containing protein [Pseudoalteromonas sp. MMG022]|uniref:winged helix-turn-helix domain-containing protein n=1 Tax=Pseudoalteromonas sp. MMG022 TaxID=2909978 RepID=UPI001F02B03C|nr:winged helix-turn-helix domain-containing protein [Pseudoalteromonas sp. MMG022]MCF6434891.1 winged helix-turn-helix domain-containing protein [Pseudoalteromonas sp. MMG022]
MMKKIIVLREEHKICIDGRFIDIEPKVFAVLEYLYVNKDRFVSINELHDQVWDGVMVSDAAVRRCISKLRSAFDDDPKQPKYIQLISKRGYKLICDVHFCTAKKCPTKEQLPAECHYWSEPKKSRNWHKLIQVCTVFTLVMIFIAFIPISNQLTLSEPQQNTSRIGTAHIAFAYALDNQYAYATKLSGEPTFSIMLRDQHRGTDEAVLKGVTWPDAMGFSGSGSTLYVSDVKKGNSEIVSINIQTGETTTIVDKFTFIADIFLPEDDSLLYFVASDDEAHSFNLYQYNVSTAQHRSVIKNPETFIHFFAGAIAPDNQHIALLSYNTLQNTTALEIYSTKEFSKVSHTLIESTVFDLDWLDNEQVILASDKGIQNLSIQGDSRSIITEQVVHMLSVDKRNQRIHTSNTAQKTSFFYQIPLPLNSKNTKSYYHFSEDINLLVSEIDDNKYIGLARHDDSSEIVSFNNARPNNTNSIYKTVQPITHISHAADAQALAFIEQGKVKIVNYASLHVFSVPLGNVQPQSISLLADGESIYFTARSNSAWHVYYWDGVKVQHQLEGFRYVFESKGQLLLVADDGSLYLRSATGALRTLNKQAQLEANSQITFVDNMVIWTEHDLASVTFHQLDLNNDTFHRSLSIPYDKYATKFYINNENNKLIVKGGSAIQHEEWQSQIKITKKFVLSYVVEALL